MRLAINWGVDREKAPKVMEWGHACAASRRERRGEEGGHSRLDPVWRQQMCRRAQQTVG